MPYVSPRSRLARRVSLFGALALGAGLLAWGVRGLAQLGPKDATAVSETDIPTGLNPAQRNLAAEVAALERRLVATGADESEESRAAQLDQMIARQRELVELSRYPVREEVERLERFERKRDTRVAQQAQKQLLEWERGAEQAWETGQDEAAAGQWRSALALQQTINRSRAEARVKNFVREARLAQQVEMAEARPLRRRVDAALARAEAATLRQDWAEVLKAKQEAREGLAELNGRWPKSRLADLGLQATLGGEIAALEAADMAAEIEAREKGGDAAATAGRPEMAAEFYATAAAAQLDVNRRYPGSRFASARRAETLEVKRQTVLATAAWPEVVALDARARELLRRRQTINAIAQIEAATFRLEQIEAEWPKSQVIDSGLRLKLAFLLRQAVGLRTLQDAVYAQLVPVPGVPDRLMARTEVTQAFYAQIMGTNPSRRAGRSWPVDSVDRADARQFCVRLSWLLGVVVRLPTEKEFCAALGHDPARGWTSANSGGAAHAAGEASPNDNGFCDLTGNVAEWLEDESDAAKVVVAGGSYLDAPLADGAPMIVATDKATRARHIGFRYVVEYPLP